jgi:5'-deoxynucleotidase YfbR-like HD superfamily hydrolase
MKPNHFLQLYETGTNVKRYHTAPIAPQNLAWHSWGVAMIANHISGPTGASANLLMACMTHDMAEGSTGDIPGPLKWNNKALNMVVEDMEAAFNRNIGLAPVFDSLTPEELTILRWSDTFELVLYCAQQLYMGNQHAQGARDRGINHILSVLHFPTAYAEVLFHACFTQEPCAEHAHIHTH